jgi:peptidoglycan hydrolase-like protein with peptidoglycan-binding domain
MSTWYPNVSGIQDNGFGGSRNGQPINGVVIHHVAGTNGLSYVANANTRNSHPTYHISKNGDVTGIVNPLRRPYSTGGTPDPNAVTFEIDNSSVGGIWPVTPESIESLIDVIVFHASQSPRAGKGFAKNEKAVTQSEFFVAWHSQYSATACPGPFLMSQLDYIVDQCNKRASGATPPTNPVAPPAPVTPPPAPGAPSEKPILIGMLKRGSTGKNVVYLQACLGLVQDGVFGPITDARVRAFQKNEGLKVDGIVGPVTWGRLPDTLSAPPKPNTKPKLTKWLRRGSTGSNVSYLQGALGIRKDGQFGPITERSVRQFQKQNGLLVDGIVGPVTWGKLP